MLKCPKHMKVVILGYVWPELTSSAAGNVQVDFATLILQ